MKPIWNYLLMATLFTTPLITTAVQAQKPMGKDGFWVVESNVSTPQKATVYFYNVQHQLVYKEEVAHVKLDLSRAKVRRHLNAVLQQCIAAWKRENNLLLANRMQ